MTCAGGELNLGGMANSFAMRGRCRCDEVKSQESATPSHPSEKNGEAGGGRLFTCRGYLVLVLVVDRVRQHLVELASPERDTPFVDPLDLFGVAK